MTSFVSKQNYHVLIVLVDSTISTGWDGPPPPPIRLSPKTKKMFIYFLSIYRRKKAWFRLLRMLSLYQDLERHSWAPYGTPLCVYGDPAYPHRVNLQIGLKGAWLTPAQERFNQSTSDVRATVEWSFGEITTYWAFTDFKKNLKIGMSTVRRQYLVATLLKNALVCCYGSQVSQYFDLAPPNLEEYFHLK